MRRWENRGAPNLQVAAALEEMARQPRKQGPLLDLTFDDTGYALPPWRAFPDYPRHTTGWRMGGGQDYWIEFPKWYRTLTPTQRSDYREAYQAPDGWEDYYQLIESK